MIRLFLLLIAVASGVTAIWMFSVRPPPPGPVTSAPVTSDTTQTGSGTETITEPNEIEKAEVLVAARPLPARQVLTGESVRWEAIEASRAPSDSYRRENISDTLEEVIGKVSINQLDEGEVLRQSRVQEGRPENLSMLLEPGKRAISIIVSEEVMAGGFILPNDHVDVVHVRELENNTTQSRVLARNVKVIALDQSTSEMIEESNYISRTATLKVDAEDVVPITAAQSSGRLILALRSAADDDEARPVLRQPGQPTEPQPKSIRVIRDGQVETITVQP